MTSHNRYNYCSSDHPVKPRSLDHSSSIIRLQSNRQLCYPQNTKKSIDNLINTLTIKQNTEYDTKSILFLLSIAFHGTQLGTSPGRRSSRPQQRRSGAGIDFPTTHLASFSHPPEFHPSAINYLTANGKFINYHSLARKAQRSRHSSPVPTPFPKTQN